MKILEPKVSSILLITWLFVGFFTRLDFNQMWGCIIYFGNVFDINNVIFSFSSILLVAIPIWTNKKGINKFLLITELGLWLIRLFIYKGGYAVGFTGQVPLGTVVLYDIIALFLRFLNIQNNIRLNIFKAKTIWIISFVIITIKFLFFSIPQDLYWEKLKNTKLRNERNKLIVGNWTGILKNEIIITDSVPIDSVDLVSKGEKAINLIMQLEEYQLVSRMRTEKNQVVVHIDSNMNFISEDFKCSLDFYGTMEGYYINSEDSMFYQENIFSIRKLSEDSLIISFGNEDQFKLSRNNAR